MMVSPLSTCSVRPSISILSVAIVKFRSDHASLVFDVVLELAAKVFEEALHRHRRRVAQGADGMATDAPCHAIEQFQVFGPTLAVFDAVDLLVYPAGSFAARRALAAGFLEVEIGQSFQRAYHAHRFVHHDDRTR